MFACGLNIVLRFRNKYGSQNFFVPAKKLSSSQVCEKR